MTDHLTNARRVTWANAALREFRIMTGCGHEDSLGDLLCDLMHWADANNFDFEAALCRAGEQYRAELEEEAGADTAVNADLLAALGLAVTALNTAPRFRVPAAGDGMDSYKIAALCDRAIARTKSGAPA